MKYDFLALALLCSIPGAIVVLFRKDLRKVVAVTAACSVPFAATERFFYPEYWSPTFLFDLVHVLGFGIEDVLQVTATAAYTTTAYPFVFRRALAPIPGETSGVFGMATRAGSLIVMMLVVSVGLYLGPRVPIIFGSFVAMTLASIIMLSRRRDLVVPAILGGILSTATYGLICLFYARLVPGVFERVWHTGGLMHRFVLGVPIEELLYGITSGTAAGAFYPYVARMRFVRMGA